MRFSAAILIAVCAMAAGCTSLVSRTRERDRDRIDRPTDRPSDQPWWQEGPELAGRDKSRPVQDSIGRNNREGIIAGEVFDALEGKRLTGKTYIVVRPADEVEPASTRKGTGVETDEDGYFFMPMLTPGKTYILSAVREFDGRKIAGEVQIKPPAGNIRLELDSNKVSSVTPAMPPPPNMGPFEKNGQTGGNRPAPAATDKGWDGVPKIDPPAPPIDKENIAGNPMLPPMASIRPPPAPVPSGASARPNEEEASAKPTAQRIANFRISDVIGNDWELRYADGRLILMDFWGTTCVPCQKAMPSIKRLQADYGTSGLEIVGLACEDGTFAQRARAVDDMARRKELNYKVYLEREGRVGEVQRLFDVRWIPTLVLLDRQGNVLWRGGATDPEIGRLEEIIKTNLTKR